MEINKKIYIMLSQTHTKFGRFLRNVGKIKYNHASIALDAELERLYAFARPQRNGIFFGRLVRESMLSYTLGKANVVNILIFELEVTAEQYKWVEDTVTRIHNDEEYIYNLLSVLTHPISKGFSAYKAFTCSEFVMYLLKGIGYEVPKPLCRYKPDDLVDFLGETVYFKGNLLDYKKNNYRGAEEFFSPMSYNIMKKNLVGIKKICSRSILRHHF